jgi:uncharacterized protein
MRQFVFATLYSLVGLAFLLVTFASINETAIGNKKTTDEIQIIKPINFTTETTTAPEMEMSSDDIQTMVQKLNFARSVLEEFWSNEFARNGFRYYSPNVKIFRGSMNSACGGVSEAAYCFGDRTIYLNADFLFSQMDNVSRRLGTDGDMAAIVVIAHEYSHHTQAQVPIFSRFQELNADCMAGAFTRYSAQKGVLDSDDIAEARNGLANNPEYSVWFNRNSHGTSIERMSAFDRGYSGGVGVCR